MFEFNANQMESLGRCNAYSTTFLDKFVIVLWGKPFDKYRFIQNDESLTKKFHRAVMFCNEAQAKEYFENLSRKLDSYGAEFKAEVVPAVTFCKIAYKLSFQHFPEDPDDLTTLIYQPYNSQIASDSDDIIENAKDILPKVIEKTNEYIEQTNQKIDKYNKTIEKCKGIIKQLEKGE